MAHNLKGKKVVIMPSSVDVVFTKVLDFMDNVTEFPWVVEEVSTTEKRYYFDDSRTVGLAAVKGTQPNNTGLFIINGDKKRTNATICATTTTMNMFLYWHISSGENTIYIGGYNSTNNSYGIVAAKDESGKWAVLYNQSNGYIAYDNIIDVYCKLADYKNYDYISSSFCITKAPNGISGTEFKELYYVPFCPVQPAIDNTNGIQEIYISADGKTYRLVPLFKNYIVLAFPVSD